MSEDENIQQVCHQVTKTHAIDEWGHSSVFSFVAVDIVNQLHKRQKEYLKDIILNTVNLFADNEMSAWSAVFSLIDFPHYKEILLDTSEKDEIAVYTNSVVSLLERIGLDHHKNEAIDKLNN